MADKKIRKSFEQCSSRHQRRIIQEDITNVYRHNQKYMQLRDNRVKIHPYNIFHNNASSINSPIYDEAQQVCNANNELQNRNLEKDFDRNLPIDLESLESNDLESLETNHEENIQLLEVSSNNIDKYNENYLEELINDYNEYYHYIFEDDSDVNEDEDVQSDDEKSENFRSNLRDWALRNNVTHKATNELLQLLLQYIPNCSLRPKDVRTLLHTSQTTNYMNVAGGEYVHFGLSNVITLLIDKYANVGLTVNNVILSLNIDGLPLSRSSPHCFWPILVSDKIFNSVHMIGLYYGASKPTSANEFLKQFINELQILIQDGFMYREHRIHVILSTIICDAPAKSFALYIKGHTGFSSCTKCTIVGEYIQKTMCFPYSKMYNLRTDEDFVQQTDEEYHHGQTLLLKIPNIGLVSAVALDYMHLVCLGIVKKLLLLWIKGPLTIRIGTKDINRISEHLITLQNSTPKEFSRKPRSLSEIKHWKATEFRQFLLYTGPIVLKSVLKSEIYEHFVTLHVAISILITPTLTVHEENIKYAEVLLTYFVETFQVLYGKQFVSHNVHNLLHLSNEVRRNGALDNFSAFRFESFLGSLKKLIRKPEKPLQQIARRYSEQQCRMFQEQLIDSECHLKHKHNNGPLLPEFHHKTITQYKILQNDLYYIHCDDASNNILMLENKIIIRVLNIVQQTNDIYIIGQQFNIIHSIYERPCLSVILLMFAVEEDNNLCYWSVKQIMCKMWIIQSATKFIVIPLRHNKH